MARLHEYQGKAILAANGFKIPRGRAASTAMWTAPSGPSSLTGMNAAAFNSIFMIARTPGLVAHVLEEQTREKPMRRIDPVKHGYDGPPPRGISDGNPKSQDPNPREKGDQR